MTNPACKAKAVGDACRSASMSQDHPGLRVTSIVSELDLDIVHGFLSEHCNWARGIPRPLLERAIEHSICFGGFIGSDQVAFARVVTDRATFANLVDVFVLAAHRRKGYAVVLLRAVMAHPDLQGLRRFTLATGDAHDLYRRFGFDAPLRPQSLMERYFPEIYLQPAVASERSVHGGPSE